MAAVAVAMEEEERLVVAEKVEVVSRAAAEANAEVEEDVMARVVAQGDMNGIPAQPSPRP